MRSAALACALAASTALATPSGHKWFMDPCSTGTQCHAGTEQCSASHCTATVRIAVSVENSGGTVLTGSQSLAYSTFVARAQEAFKNWTSTRVSGCATGWDVKYQGTFSTPSGTAAVSMSDGANNVIWLQGSNWRYSSATLGLTTDAYLTSTGQVIDADMELNNIATWSDNKSAQTYDMESVVLHEAGHFLGLDHTTDNAIAVMYPTVAMGDAKRTLSAIDTADVCTVYPGAPGSQGTSCASASTCTGGRVCEGAPAAGAAKMCTQDCAAVGASCPQGYTCQPSSAGFACLAQVGATDLCKFCSSGADCSTSVCLTDGVGHNWCSKACTSAAQCGAGYQCNTGGAGSNCEPVAMCTNQCTSASQCTVGYGCTGGTCQPTGNTGDRCEVSAWCKGCGVCILDPVNTSVAFCRTCCQGAGGGGYCTACADLSCTAGASCVGLTNGQDSICLPTSGGGVCATCGGSVTCQNGMTCAGGKCHAACNAANPGACQACLDVGGGNTICACPGEVVGLGEPCGTAGGIVACAPGLLCVTAPAPTCRALCNKNDPNSCATGDKCTTVGGKDVCLPGAAGARCAACSAGGTCDPGLSCFNSRCYPTCNTGAAARCASCVQTDSTGAGVCACDDQIVGVNQRCGLPNVTACVAGSLCLNGTCRGLCDPNAPFACPANTECKPYSNSTYCLDSVDPGVGGGAGGGSGGGTAGGTGSGAGTGGGSGTVSDQGCGCGAGADLAFAWPVMLGLLGLRRRR